RESHGGLASGSQKSRSSSHTAMDSQSRSLGIGLAASDGGHLLEQRRTRCSPRRFNHKGLRLSYPTIWGSRRLICLSMTPLQGLNGSPRPIYAYSRPCDRRSPGKENG